MNDYNIRWVVKEDYFGKFNSVSPLCYTQSIHEAAFIIDSISMKCSGRPIRFFAEKIASDFNEDFDTIKGYSLLSGDSFDFSKYLEGITCL